MSLVMPSLLLLLGCSSLFAQTKSAIYIGYEEAGQHAVGPRHTWVRVPGPNRGLPFIRLTLTVSPQGDVVHAEAHGNDAEMQAWSQAQAIVYGWKYRPFLRDGHPVEAELQSGISLVPLEKLPKTIAGPVLRPNSQIAISLQRTACYGTCPAYTVTLDGHNVTFQGDRFTATYGTHTAAISSEVLHALAQRMLEANWFGMDDQYRAMVTDNPTQTVTLTIDGQTKKIVDYVGIEASMPDAIRDFEYEIDRVAGASRWVDADSGLAPLLKAEDFDFRSFAAQSTLRTAAAKGKVVSVQELLAAGVPRERVPKPAEPPAWGRGWNGFDGLLTAAARQPDALRVLIDSGVASQDQADKDIALAAAVNAGNAVSAQMLLQYGANPRVDFAALRSQAGEAAYWLKDSTTLLTNAVRSGDPDTVQLMLVLPTLKASVRGDLLFDLAYHGSGEQSQHRAECARLLLNAGADVNAKDDHGRTALHVAQGLPLITTLVKAGADVNAQDRDGNTPLFTTYDPSVFRFLIAHGASLAMRNHAGQTPLDNPQRSPQEWAPVYAEVKAAQLSK